MIKNITNEHLEKFIKKYKNKYINKNFSEEDIRIICNSLFAFINYSMDNNFYLDIRVHSYFKFSFKEYRLNYIKKSLDKEELIKDIPESKLKIYEEIIKDTEVLKDKRIMAKRFNIAISEKISKNFNSKKKKIII